MWTWVFGIVSVDLCYYGYHRFAHRVNFGWATHVVHHQSEEYNLAVALRQPWFAQFSAWLVYLPLAVLGLPPEVYGLSTPSICSINFGFTHGSSVSWDPLNGS